MNRKLCQHGVLLPRGLKCDRGYLIIRLKTAEGPFNQGCGPHTPAMEKTARLALENIRVQQKLGKFNLPSKIKRIRFDDAADVYQQKHFVEYRDPVSNAPRSPQSIKTNRSRMAALKSYFGNYYLDAIMLPALKAYRKKRLEYDDVANGTVNRDMAILSSMINCFKSWNLAKEIEPVALPKDETGQFINPCQFLPDLNEVPRNRIASLHELKLLKEACFMLKDPGMWSIIGTEFVSCLRKADLKTYLMTESDSGVVTIEQSKTGMSISLPKLQRPDWAKVWTNFDARWEKVRVAAGVPDLQFRDLRKTGLRMAHGLGFSISDVANLAGHADSKTTTKHYLDLTKAKADGNALLMQALEKQLEGI